MNINAVMNSMKISSAKGFTLLELIITLAIAGILLGVGVPSFTSMMAESKIGAQYNSLVGSLYHARSEAIKGAADVTVCPRQAAGAFNCGTDGDWENGWIVFIDSANTPGELLAVVESQDDIIAVNPAMKGLNTVTSFGSTTNTVATAAPVNYVRYLQNGTSSLTTGSIVICDVSRGPAASRSLNVVQTGDIRKGTATEGNDAPRDVFNRAISLFCPDPA